MIIINYQKKKIIHSLEIDSIPTYFKSIHPQNTKPNNQLEILSRSFESKNSLTLFEYLNLDKHNLVRLSFVELLDYAIHHNPEIITKLQKPVFIENKKQLVLTQNTIHQLDIVEDKNRTKVSKFNSLLGIINKCSTSIGKRLLVNRILNPILDITYCNKDTI